MDDGSSSAPTPRWADQPHLLYDLAVADIAAGGDVRPTLVAFCGEQALFLATLRPFDKGGYHDPVIEVGAVAAGLGADRLLLSLSGRAWSTRDPIPPVLGEEIDLRQRVIVLHDADGTTAPVTVVTTIIPFEVDAATGGLVRGEAVVDEAGEGWILRTLSTIVTATGRVPADAAALGAQILRCERLGHQLVWSRDCAAYARRLRLLPLG